MNTPGSPSRRGLLRGLLALPLARRFAPPVPTVAGRVIYRRTSYIMVLDPALGNDMLAKCGIWRSGGGLGRHTGYDVDG